MDLVVAAFPSTAPARGRVSRGWRGRRGGIRSAGVLSRGTRYGRRQTPAWMVRRYVVLAWEVSPSDRSRIQTLVVNAKYVKVSPRLRERCNSLAVPKESCLVATLPLPRFSPLEHAPTITIPLLKVGFHHKKARSPSQSHHVNERPCRNNIMRVEKDRQRS